MGHKRTFHLRFASMMTSERSVDGISKLLSKADSEKLRAAGKRDAVNKAEYLGVSSRYCFYSKLGDVYGFLFFFHIILYQANTRQLLEDAWNVHQKQHTSEHSIGAFGRACVRVALHLLQKEKLGPEPHGYKDLTAIADKFAVEVAQGQQVVETAASSSMSGGSAVVNLLEATPVQKALLQNPHMQEKAW